MARATRARIIAIAGIGCATVTPKNRGRNLFRLATRRMSGIAIATNARANGKRATKQNGVRATGTGISDALTLRRGIIATAASGIPIG